MGRNFYDRELESRLAQRTHAQRRQREALRARLAASTPMPWHVARLDADGRCIYDGLTVAAHALPVEPAEDNEVRTSVMVALFPSADAASELALDGGEEVDDLHVTLAFLGKTADLNGRNDELRQTIAEFAAQHAPLAGEVSGLGLFTAGPSPVTYASVDLPALPSFREALIVALEGAGFAVAKNHGYTPHMTLAYGDHRNHNPKNIELAFSDITVAIGGERSSYPLTGVETAAERKKNVGEGPHDYKHPAGDADTLMDESKFTPPCAHCALPFDDLVHQALGDPVSDIDIDADGDGTADDNATGATKPNPMPDAHQPKRRQKSRVESQRDAEKCMQGIDAGVDQALVLLRSTPDLPEYAGQARDVLHAVDEACDNMLAWFGVPDTDEPEQSVSILVNEPDLERAPDPADPVQRAFISEINGHTFITGPADLVMDGWERALTSNEHVKWVQGRFVGAEKANRNGALWSTQDLEFGQPTVQHGPLNWLHESRHIIGTIADAKLVLPNGETAADALGVVNEPHINALSAVWSWIYPDETYVIEQASDAGKLWYSMECISKSVQCVGEGSCGAEAAYMDYIKGAGGSCDHMRERSATRRFADPTFLGGAVIVPPVRPGWADADARFMREASALAEGSFELANPSMTASEWELLMSQLVTYART